MPPVYPTETHENTSKKKLILVLIFFTVLIAGVTALGLLYYKTRTEMQSQLDSKNSKISDLQGQNANFLKQIDALKKPVKEEPEPVKTDGFREIPELGVKYALNDQTKGLTYSYNLNGITFSTVDLSNSAPYTGKTEDGNCTSPNGPGGSIEKLKPSDRVVSGTTAEVAANSPEQKDSFKKIDEFYFYLGHPNAPCSQKADLKPKIDQALAAGKVAFNSLQAIE